MRDPLPADVIDHIRRERVSPRVIDPHWLHLRGLLGALRRAFATLDPPSGPVVDVFCGTQPYRSIEPWPLVWGLDIDHRFGSADVLGDARLPFRTASLSVAVCTQTLYLLDDAVALVQELRRALAPGGVVVVSVPLRFRKEHTGTERQYRLHELPDLFGGWSAVELFTAGGPGTGFAYAIGHRLESLERRAPVLRPIIRVVSVGVNATGRVLDVCCAPFNPVPATVVLTARRPAH